MSTIPHIEGISFTLQIDKETEAQDLSKVTDIICVAGLGAARGPSAVLDPPRRLKVSHFRPVDTLPTEMKDHRW